MSQKTKQAQTYFKALHFLLILASVLCMCLWLSNSIKARKDMKSVASCRKFYKGSYSELTLQVNLLFGTLSLVVLGNLLLLISLPKEAREWLTLSVECLIQATDLFAIFSLAFTLGLDRLSPFYYEHDAECNFQVFRDLKTGEAQFASFYLLLISTAVKTAIAQQY